MVIVQNNLTLVKVQDHESRSTIYSDTHSERLIRKKLAAPHAFTRKARQVSEMKSWVFFLLLFKLVEKKIKNPTRRKEKSAQQKVISLRVKN